MTYDHSQCRICKKTIGHDSCVKYGVRHYAHHECYLDAGKVLGLWDVITPATMGFTGAEARQMAGNGFVMMTGFKAAAP